MAGLTTEPLTAVDLEALLTRAAKAGAEEALARLGHGRANGHSNGTAAPPRAAGELLTQPEAWAFCGLSRSRWFALRARGKLPAPVSPDGARPLWRRADLSAFIARLKPARRAGGSRGRQ